MAASQRRLFVQCHTLLKRFLNDTCHAPRIGRHTLKILRQPASGTQTFDSLSNSNATQFHNILKIANNHCRSKARNIPFIFQVALYEGSSTKPVTLCLFRKIISFVICLSTECILQYLLMAKPTVILKILHLRYVTLGRNLPSESFHSSFE